MERKEELDFETHYNILKTQSKSVLDVFEVTYLYRIKPNERFKMLEGFKSFKLFTKECISQKATNKQFFQLIMQKYLCLYTKHKA